MKVQFAVIGTGLSGLSFAYHVGGGENCVLFEKEGDVGGLCRSRNVDGFTFDYTGHLLHCRHDYTRKLIGSILPGAFSRIERHSGIFLRGMVTPYPFQANTYGLPLDVVKECLLGFIETLAHHGKPVEKNTLGRWIYETFGSGISRHFMIPYNRKLWCRDLDEMTAEWTVWAVPRPTIEEVIDGALGKDVKGLGYNPTFLYPARGGIDVLPKAFRDRIDCPVLTGVSVDEISLEEKTLLLSDSRAVRFDHLISSMPLKELLAIIVDLPEKYRAVGRGLKCNKVIAFNMGVKREKISPWHWLYFPEDEFVFYRIGFPTNFSGGVAPRGTSSMYVEISRREEEHVEPDRLRSAVVEGLRGAGIIKNEKEIIAEEVLRIDPAYIIFDKFRLENLPPLFHFLEESNVYPIGRFGSWDYSSMEKAVLDGRRIAVKLTGMEVL